jgi:hypothetical protein
VRTLQRTFVGTLMAIAAVLGLSVVVTPAADATVYSSCTMSRCSAARSAETTWEAKGYPGTRGWYDWPNGQCNFAGGTFRNDEGHRRHVPQRRGPAAERSLVPRVRRVPPLVRRLPRRVPDRRGPEHRRGLVLPQPLRRLLPAVGHVNAVAGRPATALSPHYGPVTRISTSGPGFGPPTRAAQASGPVTVTSVRTVSSTRCSGVPTATTAHSSCAGPV